MSVYVKRHRCFKNGAFYQLVVLGLMGLLGLMGMFFKRPMRPERPKRDLRDLEAQDKTRPNKVRVMLTARQTMSD